METALYIALDSALKGQHTLARHEDFREDQNRWRQRFKDGQGLVPAVFPTWDNEAA
ncbi:hypothetical protein [Kribbella sindirgiensis]|uniref:hypothetical protein n=1 Tax=Kribbella sindirgiensis TaxID=1124744 RepID=UPI0013F42595|nr:hypothetical protein [Kribbella sindirgiensis]